MIGVFKNVMLIFSLAVSTAAYADLTVRLPKESIQTCISQKGEVFRCYYEEGLCFVPVAVGPIKDRTEYRLTPCSGAPLVLSHEQELHMHETHSGREHKLSECRKIQRNYLSGDQPENSENSLWLLVECMKIEADLQYDQEKEKVLYDKIVSLLELLLKYPGSKIKAHIELGTIYETYFQDFTSAYNQYKMIPLEEHPYVFVAMAKTACAASYPEKSSNGLIHYLSAIEKNILNIDINNLKPKILHLNNILESCGYKNLIPLLDQQKWLVTKSGERDLKKTLKFVRKYL